MKNSLCELSAVAAVDLLRNKEVSPTELVHASAARIEQTDGDINAMPTLCIERALQHAKAIENSKPSSNGKNGLCGLPIAVKDLHETKGVLTTFGSPIFKDNIPQRSDLIVERIESMGGIVMGKSNTPEFGAGASTFNEVFGVTRNPHNNAKTVGGSSGGSAAALAANQVWGATGSDLGGSLRIPASFCGVVGLRPSPGFVPQGPRSTPYSPLAVSGPMGRTVADTDLLLRAMHGTHTQDPLTFTHTEAVEACKPRRVAYSPDLGVVPVDPVIVQACEKAVAQLENNGVEVVRTSPDFSGSIEAFQTLRAFEFAIDFKGKLEIYKDQFKPEVIWNIEKGLALTANEIADAESVRVRLIHDMANFFNDFDLLLTPTTIVPPFNAEVRYIEEVNGHKFDNYVHWLAITFVVTLTACPAVSIPCGKTNDNMPVGMQLVGPYRSDFELLHKAAVLETIWAG